MLERLGDYMLINGTVYAVLDLGYTIQLDGEASGIWSVVVKDPDNYIVDRYDVHEGTVLFNVENGYWKEVK